MGQIGYQSNNTRYRSNRIHLVPQRDGGECKKSQNLTDLLDNRFELFGYTQLIHWHASGKVQAIYLENKTLFRFLLKKVTAKVHSKIASTATNDKFLIEV